MTTPGILPNAYLDLFLTGLDANKPATPPYQAGRHTAFYYATDTNIVYRWNAATSLWDSTAPAPVAVGAAASATKANLVTYLLNQAAGSTLTLPGATGSGLIIPVVVTVTVTSNANKILTNPITDKLIGNVTVQNANATKQFSAATASGFHSIQMPFAGSQPSGGFEGDWLDIQDIATGVWLVSGMLQSGTATQLTPFSTATS